MSTRSIASSDGSYKRQSAIARRNNLRQLLLRASRVVNAEIVAELRERGHSIGASHTALLSNLDADGNALSKVASRAGMTKQAMGRLADDLQRAGYIKSTDDKTDKRSRILQFTAKGWKLMTDSFDALDTIERRYASRMGIAKLEGLRTALVVLLESSETDSLPLDA